MDAQDSDPARVARAVLALAVALLLLALPQPAPRAARCDAPGSALAKHGHTLVVRCGVAGDAPLEGPARLLFGQGLDPNTADAASLALLPGIGAGKADAIVRERARKPFLRPEDLERVPGIASATRARLRPWLRFPTDATPETISVDPPGPGK